MSGVTAEHVGPHQKNADFTFVGGSKDRKVFKRFAYVFLRLRVIEPDLRIDDRFIRLDMTAEILARAGGVAADEKTHHVGDVLLGPGKPILQGQEVSAEVLGLARDKAQDLWKAPEHAHLAGAGVRGFLTAAAKPLQE